MPSLQSHLMRPLLRRMVRPNSARSIDAMRTFSASNQQFIRLPADVALIPAVAAGVPVEWVSTPHHREDAVLLFLHGGGFVVGWSAMYRAFTALLSRLTGLRVLAPDYGLAPEHPFPAALDDCYAVYHWLLEQGYAPENIIVAGDSAGGNLTLTLLLRLRDGGDPLPAAAVCISPVTDLAYTGRTWETNANLEAMLNPPDMQRLGRLYVGDHDPRDPLISPLYADLRGLPPLLIHAGEHEVLLSDAVELARVAEAAGVDVTTVVWPGMWHVWHLFAPQLPEASDATNEISAFINHYIGRPL
ncbi:MAG: alpha/beta hydrolase [bacterium]|nr:alpha/beta hydrolase [bacterium]